MSEQLTPGQVVKDRTVQTEFKGNWLTFKKINFVDPVENKQRTWEFVQRNHHITESSTNLSDIQGDIVDAVEIVAILKNGRNDDDKIILVKQFRPPVNRYCLEFPAGLLDQGEIAIQTAHRELLEETGYIIDKIVKISPVLFYEPGLSNSNMKLVYAEVKLFHCKLILIGCSQQESESLAKV